jgi:hypothetical protein
MYVQSSVYTRPGYVYTPSIVIQVGFLTSALFESPNSHHYYFGDYYGVEYSRRGFHPWFEVDQRHRGYDPIFAHQRWQHGRTDKHWEQNVREDYTYRQQHVDARPSRTYSTQAAVAARAPERERKNLSIAAQLSVVSKRRDAPIQFETINATRRQSFGGQAKDVAKFRNARAQWESNPKSAAKVEPIRAQPQIVQPQQSQKNIEPPIAQLKAQKPSNEPVFSMPERVKIPRSPVIGRPASAPGQFGNPPVRPDIPKPEPNIRSKSADMDNSRDVAPAPRDTAPSDGKNQDNKGKSGGKNRNR